MTWTESECPVCGKDTSGMLPLIIYYEGGRYRFYPCGIHDDEVKDPTWQKSYFESAEGKKKRQSYGCL
jgi:hypothetical protein